MTSLKNQRLITITERFRYFELALKQQEWIDNDRVNARCGGSRKSSLLLFGDDIEDIFGFPRNIFPQWAATVAHYLGHFTAPTDLPEFYSKLLAFAKRCQSLNDSDWEKMRVSFTIAALRQAVAIGLQSQPVRPASHWRQLCSASENLVIELEKSEHGTPIDYSVTMAAEKSLLKARSAARRIKPQTKATDVTVYLTFTLDLAVAYLSRERTEKITEEITKRSDETFEWPKLQKSVQYFGQMIESVQRVPQELKTSSLDNFLANIEISTKLLATRWFNLA